MIQLLNGLDTLYANISSLSHLWLLHLSLSTSRRIWGLRAVWVSTWMKHHTNASNPVYVRRVYPSALAFSLCHCTDTHIYVFPLALALSIHNKQTNGHVVSGVVYLLFKRYATLGNEKTIELFSCTPSHIYALWRSSSKFIVLYLDSRTSSRPWDMKCSCGVTK